MQKSLISKSLYSELKLEMLGVMEVACSEPSQTKWTEMSKLTSSCGRKHVDI